MIFKSIEFLKEQLTVYTDGFPASDLPGVVKPYIKAENLASIEEGELLNLNNLVITLVNINEDATLKNIPNYQTDVEQTIYKNPPVYLNLFLLFSACFKSYSNALLMLSRTIRFFQAKNTFTHKNSITQVKDMDSFHLVMDLYSPSFEQVNYIWSTLGGKQRPFVMYKLRMVEMKRESIDETRGIIKTISMENSSILK